MNSTENVKNPFLSVCIPAYNRPEYLKDLLVTIGQQDYDNYEVVITDDNSPRHVEIKAVVDELQEQFPGTVFRYIRNEKTLGYDGNFRSLVTHAKGDFCVYMGDDDLLCEGALKRIAEVIRQHPDIGVIIRSWARAERDTLKIIENYRYFDGHRLFPPGARTVATLFRRSVQIAGYTINRNEAVKYGTDRFDGTLLYQLYLTGMVSYTNGGYYLPDLIAIMRKDPDLKPTHFFGNAEAEKGRFVPGMLTTDTSLNFVGGMIEIARYLSDFYHDENLYKQLMKDLGNYSYPLLFVQRDKPLKEYVGYFRKLKNMGFQGNPYIYLYFIILLLLGRRLSSNLIVLIKKVLGKTPSIGGLYEGESVSQ